eukprot:scpid69449/ scgid13382/ Dol-P-Glc:Glc(2)Man(9)GlcNAc(2)-PP-Dol alpha-1,2-glucosyltransferase; Alpha-1,2-glucosyltransferase ALG10-A; Alpha-2-glucosyltransferase ALG10-A; Asparagine-linked glycosylation protein 10 homolog A
MISLVFVTVSLTVNACILAAIHNVQPTPYMDEIFHVPQTVQYCHGNWSSWDPMITTLPGLYILSNGFLRIVSIFSGLPVTSLCSTAWLRAFNSLLSGATAFVLIQLASALQVSTDVKPKPSFVDQLSGFVLSFFPVLYFFSFLYYTDVLSTLMVLTCYWLSCRNFHFLAALAGAFSICCRQTNVVWVGFAAAISALRILEGKSKTFSSVSKSGKALLYLLPEAVRHLPSLVFSLWPYIPVLLGFVAFVFYNDGIVVGDRSNHQVSIHAAQLCYFLLLSAAFAFGHFLRRDVIYGTLGSLWEMIKQPYLLIFFISGMFAMLTKGSVVHQYLLADNRHYTFYLWKKILGPAVQRISLVPLCLLCMLTLLSSLRLHHGKRPAWLLVYLLATAAVCIPQKLLELRYFIVPYLLLRLHMPRPRLWSLVLELLVYCAVNAITIYLFMYKPFQWPSETGLQRFMW